MIKKNIRPALLLTAFISINAYADCIPKDEVVSIDEFLNETSRYEKLISFQEKKIGLLEKEKKELQNQLSNLMDSKQADDKKNIEKTPNKVDVAKENQSQVSSNLKGVQTITVEEAKVFIDKSQKFSPYSFFKGERVETESCDNQGWCKLKDKNLYIKQLSILPIN